MGRRPRHGRPWLGLRWLRVKGLDLTVDDGEITNEDRWWQPFVNPLVLIYSGWPYVFHAFPGASQYRNEHVTEPHLSDTILPNSMRGEFV